MNNKWRFKILPFISQDASAGTPVTLRVDRQGFYLYWFDQNHEMDLLDIATIRDVRTGQYAKKPKVRTRISPPHHLFIGRQSVHHTLYVPPVHAMSARL